MNFLKRLLSKRRGEDLRGSVPYKRAVQFVSERCEKTSRTVCLFEGEAAKLFYTERRDLGRLFRILKTDGKVCCLKREARPLRIPFYELWIPDPSGRKPETGELPVGADLPKGTKRAIRTLLDPEGKEYPFEAVKRCYKSADAALFAKTACRLPYEDYLRTPWWNAIRKERMEMDGHTCTRCGKSHVRLEVHHKTYGHKGAEALHMGDLTTLCSDCHRIVHGRK